MEPERWSEIERIYHLAREQVADRRAAFLEQTCGGDGELRREVESLLNHAQGRRNISSMVCWRRRKTLETCRSRGRGGIFRPTRRLIKPWHPAASAT
jgi:hypothetical protein